MRYTIKFLYNNKCYYQHWSDLINAPISYLLSGKRWELYYSNLYGEKAFTEWFQNNRKSLDLKSALKSYNNTHRLNISQNKFLEIYTKNSLNDLLYISKDMIRSGHYLYEKLIYEVLITIYHQILDDYFVVCKIDKTYVSFNLKTFLNKSIKYNKV